MNILITLIILSIIIFIHELGHFLAAKFFKMPVSEFSMGMGPKLISYKGNETLYCIRGIPMGGFVNIEGMDIEKPVENGFNTKPAWQRFIVLFAGVFMNFLLAFIIVVPFVAVWGRAVPDVSSKIGYIDKNAPSAKYLKVNDTITEIDGVTINSWNDIVKASSKTDENMKIKISRNGEEKEFNIKLTYSPERKRYLIGINRGYTIEKGLKPALNYYVYQFTAVFQGLKKMILGKVKSDEIAGPVGLVKIVGVFAKGGLLNLVGLMAMLSVNIGIFNLFPFPALDGGRIIFIILELFGIEVNKKIEERIHTVGIIFLIFLFLLITGNDIKNLFIK